MPIHMSMHLPVPSVLPLTVSFPLSERPVSDLVTNTSYLTKSEVNLLPLRRVLTRNKRVREAVILLKDLQPAKSNVLLRIKHVAVNYLTDFDALPGTVPGQRFIGKIPSKSSVKDRNKEFFPDERFLVFPYSTCWIQASETPCASCISAIASDLDMYHTHKNMPCTADLVYGKSLDGGLQDYIRVPSPAFSLVKVPDQVSLHDCCFLLDIALPFYSFCVDTLCPILTIEPKGRILVILSDKEKQANDCLLVMFHLRLDHSLFTFTDLRSMQEAPKLKETYKSMFHHVLVFAPEQEAVELAVSFGVATGLELSRSRYTLALFNPAKKPIFCPSDRTLHYVSLSYKDKFLLEELLSALAQLNIRGDNESSDTVTTVHGEPDESSSDSYKLSLVSMSTEESTTSIATKKSVKPTANSDDSDESSATFDVSQQIPKKQLRFEKDPFVIPMMSRAGRKHISWLHCDRDYRLCSDENCDHDSLNRCQSTSSINDMIAGRCGLQRVFYTLRPASHVKLNAFIF